MNVKSKDELNQDIAEYVLKHADELSDLACVKKFVDEYSRLTRQMSDRNKHWKRLIKAKEQFIPFENQVQMCKDSLGASEKELSQLFRPLGQAAFDAFLAGDIKQGRFLSERLELHKRIKSLEKQRASHAPQQDSGITQKAKLKAHQLAITGKIKLEEAKISRLDEEIGRRLIQENLDDSVRCDSTLKNLDEIAFLRDNVIKQRQELQKADAAQQKAINQLCEAIPLQHIESSNTLDDEIKACNKNVQELESSLTTANHLMTNSLLTLDQEKLPESLLTLLSQLKVSPPKTSEYFGMAGKEFQDATKELQRGASGIGRSAKHWWNGLSKRGQYIAIGVFGLLLLIAMFSGGGSKRNLSNKNGVPNPVVFNPIAIDEEFKIAASQKGKVELIGAVFLIDYRNNKKWSWERLELAVKEGIAFNGEKNDALMVIKDEFEEWKQSRIAAGDRYK